MDVTPLPLDGSSPLDETTGFTTLFNFRDLGGHRTGDGRVVRHRRVYRSDSLHRLDDVDRPIYRALNIRTVIDLRRPEEVKHFGRVPDFTGQIYRHIHPEHRNWLEIPYDERLGLARYLADRYLEMADTGRDGLAAAVGLIAEETAAPVVVHCVAGKDRTGIVCALTLALLGVDDDDIAADYARSTEASKRLHAHLRATLPEVELPPPFLSSPAEAMLLFLAELRQRHGSVEGYLRDAGLGAAEFTALRTHLLA